MKRAIYIISIVSFLVAGINVKAQDPDFSQFHNNFMYYNPAFAGASQGLKMGFNYRKQWPNLPNDFKTYNFAADMAIREFPGSGGLGVIFSKDKAGDGYLEKTMIGLVTAARIPLSENIISQVGINWSFNQRYVNWDELVFFDQLHPRHGIVQESQFLPPSNDRVSYPDFNVGGMMRFFQRAGMSTDLIGTVGFAVHHVFEPNQSFLNNTSKLPRKYVVHADLVFMNEGSYSIQRFGQSVQKYKSKINPFITFQSQGQFVSYNFGVNYYYSFLYTGIWFRNSDFEFLKHHSLIVQLGINSAFNDESRIKIVYSYDIALDQYVASSGGAHEISLIIELDDISVMGNKGKSGLPGRSYNTRRGMVNDRLECSPF